MCRRCLQDVGGKFSQVQEMMDVLYQCEDPANKHILYGDLTPISPTINLKKPFKLQDYSEIPISMFIVSHLSVADLLDSPGRAGRNNSNKAKRNDRTTNKQRTNIT